MLFCPSGIGNCFCGPNNADQIYFLPSPRNYYYRHIYPIRIHRMQAHSGFNFAESPSTTPADADFKKQRQAYLC
jgi:hypothetical protein